MGTPAFAVPALRAIAAAHDVVSVYSQPPRPAGRGKKDRPSAVQLAAEELGLAVRHPASLKSEAAQQDFAALNADVAVVVAYGLILPAAILNAPARGCLNIHASLLPRWRGAAPIQRAIMAGDSETGVCIMQMDEGLDTGPVLVREALTIGAEETAAELQQRLAAAGAGLVLTALGRLGELVAVPQPEQGITYAAKITKDEARIDWHRPAVQVDRQIRGLSPFPGAWCFIGGERVKLLRSRLTDGAGEPGEVLHDMVIACGTGAIEVLEAQREGRRPAAASDILRGFSLTPKLA
jgi:methionyl-tRNA formyltransferase